MTPAFLEFAKRIISYGIALCVALATLGGCVRAIEWAIATVGVIPVALIGTFVLGCVVTAALIHARQRAAAPGSPD
jgi:hypothetical protein